MRTNFYRLYFYLLPNNEGFSHWTNDNKHCLDDYIGETLANIIIQDDTPLELVRFHRYELGETIICLRELTRIVLTVQYPL